MVPKTIYTTLPGSIQTTTVIISGAVQTTTISTPPTTSTIVLSVTTTVTAEGIASPAKESLREYQANSFKVEAPPPKMTCTSGCQVDFFATELVFTQSVSIGESHV